MSSSVSANTTIVMTGAGPPMLLRLKYTSTRKAASMAAYGSERARAVYHHEPAAGRKECERGPNPRFERRAALRRREDMGPRSALVRRDANGPWFEERRVGDDAIGSFVGKPALAALAWLEHIEPQNARARLKSVARGVDLGEPRQIGIDLDQIGERPLRRKS